MWQASTFLINLPQKPCSRSANVHTEDRGSKIATYKIECNIVRYMSTCDNHPPTLILRQDRGILDVKRQTNERTFSGKQIRPKVNSKMN